jgi:hypothetical protein
LASNRLLDVLDIDFDRVRVVADRNRVVSPSDLCGRHFRGPSWTVRAVQKLVERILEFAKEVSLANSHVGDRFAARQTSQASLKLNERPDKTVRQLQDIPDQVWQNDHCANEHRIVVVDEFGEQIVEGAVWSAGQTFAAVLDEPEEKHHVPQNQVVHRPEIKHTQDHPSLNAPVHEDFRAFEMSIHAKLPKVRFPARRGVRSRPWKG